MSDTPTAPKRPASPLPDNAAKRAREDTPKGSADKAKASDKNDKNDKKMEDVKMERYVMAVHPHHLARARVLLPLHSLLTLHQRQRGWTLVQCHYLGAPDLDSCYPRQARF